MAGEWRELELKELVEISTDKVELSTVEAENYISTDNMLPNFGGIDFNLNKPSVSKTSRFQKDEILFSNIRTYFRKLWLAERNGACSNDVIVFRPRSHTSPRFLFYSLMDERFIEHTVQTSKGTKMPRGDKNAILKYIAKLPPLPEQKAIAHVLGSLDDKIELNRRMNETLEGMAQALFKSWFVDFDPVIDNALAAGNPIPEPLAQRAETRRQALANGTANRESAQAFPASFRFTEELGWIPEGWEVKPFESLLEKTIGGDWGKENEDEKHSIPAVIIRGTDMPSLSSGNISSAPTRWVEPKKFASRELKDADIVIEISGGSPKQPTGRSLFITDNILDRLGGKVEPASFCRKFSPHNKEFGLLGALHLKHIYDEGKMWEYQNQSTGISNFQTKTFLSSELLSLPESPEVLAIFYAKVRPLIDKLTNNQQIHLAKLRDVLLPKLISGELRIPQAEKMAEEAIA